MNKTLLNELKKLESFKYGCLYEDGSLITNLKEINDHDGSKIFVQTPELFLKNKVGMCHDASIYIDKICTENEINHKCIYIVSNLKPKLPTHSFVLVQLFNKQWQVIDVFATKNCLWKGPFKSFNQAVKERVQEWIKNDNHGSSDLIVFINEHMPNGGYNFLKYSEKVVNLFRLYLI